MELGTINTIMMFRTTGGTLKILQQSITGVPALVEDVNYFFTSYADIKKTTKDYINATKGKTKDKHEAIDEVVESILPIKGLLIREANKSHDNVLLEKVSYSPSVLRSGLRDELRLSIIDGILDEAEARAEVMAKGNITPEIVAAIRAKYTGLEDKYEAKDTGFNSRSALRKSLEEKVRSLSQFLETQLDPLMELIKESNRLGYDQYFAARVIIDMGGKLNLDEEDTPPTPPVQ